MTAVQEQLPQREEEKEMQGETAVEQEMQVARKKRGRTRATDEMGSEWRTGG